MVKEKAVISLHPSKPPKGIKEKSIILPGIRREKFFLFSYCFFSEDVIYCH